MRLAQRRGSVRAHPRVSGENSAIDAKAAALGGSSPRERGKLEDITGVRMAARLIPA